MDEKQLEKVMLRTAIIEPRLDVPSCITIIIESAGLGQQPQTRGRVRRFQRQAYAYLLLHQHKLRMDIVRKQLKGVRQHNQLGAVFWIAMQGAGMYGHLGTVVF